MVSRDRPRARVNGRFVKDMTTAQRHAELLKMRAGDKTFKEIAEALGYYDRHNARAAFMRLMANTVAQPAEDARRAELAKLDAEEMKLELAEQSVWDVLERKHITVSNGKVIYLGDQPLRDDGPVLAAVDTLRRLSDTRRHLSESRRKLLGLDAASKVQVITDDDLDREEQQLLDSIAGLDRATPDEDPGNSEAPPAQG